MHRHRIAAFLLGCWILGSLFMIFVATQNFATVDRVLAAPPQEAAQVFQTLGPDNARLLLRYLAGEENRLFFTTWEFAQIALGALVTAILLLATTRRVLAGITGVTLIVVLFQRFRVTPEMIALGRMVDFGGGSASAILQTTSTHLVVTVDLDASLQSEAAVGEHVKVEMPAGNAVSGRITAVSAVAQSSNGSGDSGGGGSAGPGSGSSSSSSTIPVTVALSGNHSGGGLDQAAVSVAFAKAKAKHVLSVPVTALLATSGSSYAVQQASAPHRLIPVTTGLFAAGYVEISGSGIHPGLQVTDSQG